MNRKEEMEALAKRAVDCANCRSQAYPSEVLLECAAALRASAAQEDGMKREDIVNSLLLQSVGGCFDGSWEGPMLLPEKVKFLANQIVAALAPATEGGGRKVPTKWPEPDEKMRYLGKNGYEFEREEADKLFCVGELYTVVECNVQSWSHSIKFEEVDGWFNGVMFERVRIVPLSPSPSVGTPAQPSADRGTP